MINILSIIAITGLLIVIILLILVLSRQKSFSKDEITRDFNSIAMETLKAQEKMGSKDLDSKKELIDQRLETINQEIVKVEQAVQRFNSASGEKFQGLTAKMESSDRIISELRATTGRLSELLVSNQKRGEWGERMAKDILDLMGMKEGINYRQQTSTASGQPDFTFTLPNGNRINMDCKFPFSNYKNYVEAQGQSDRDAHLKVFKSDVRKRLKEIAGRDYINPEEGTLDYALMFIPNEQVFNFINEQDPGFIDEAMGMKIIVSSPFTLYAFLSVIRQASENYRMEKESGEILAQLGNFTKQWEEYKSGYAELADAIRKVQEAFDHLTTTRTKKLESQLRAIEKIKMRKE